LRGLAFAPFRDCQTPLGGPFPTREQERDDMTLIQGMANGVRVYSARHEDAVEFAAGLGLRVSAGVWLGPETTDEQRAANRAEVEAVIGLARRVKLESIVVGNEVLLRGELEPATLAAYVLDVKRRAAGVPVTTGEIADRLLDPANRSVVDALDYVLLHVHPYWEGVPIESAAWHVARVSQRVADATGKRVVIGETGWPSAGPALGAAVPSIANAAQFLADWRAVADHEQIDYFYFSAADEKWKAENGVGAHWGLLDAARRPKHGTVDLRSTTGPPVPVERSAVAAPSRGSASGLPQAVDRRSAANGSLTIYRTWPPPGTYVPSGWMGDRSTISVDECSTGRVRTSDPASVDHGVRVGYSGRKGRYGWAGVYWQHPASNWGTRDGGHDLTGLNAIEFYARGRRGGERVTFVAGGSTKADARWRDSLGKRSITVTLTTAWRRYVIDLRDGDLRRVIGGFGWSASRADNPRGAVFFLDDIAAVTTTLPRRVCHDLPTGSPAGTLYVLDGANLCARNSPAGRYDFGIDTSAHATGWLRRTAEGIRLDYPAGQAWGVAFVTVGAVGSRRGQDLSACHTLRVDIRAHTTNGSVAVGMKDSTDADDGSETKVGIRVGKAWRTWSFPLSRFTGLNRRSVHIVIEFVFGGAARKSITFRNVRVLC
jgi:exo-beta-1,3-glucanase (GH17 family)